MPEKDDEKKQLLSIAKRLVDVAEELFWLNDDQKMRVFERTDANEEWYLKNLYYSFDEYFYIDEDEEAE